MRDVIECPLEKEASRGTIVFFLIFCLYKIGYKSTFKIAGQNRIIGDNKSENETICLLFKRK